MKKLFYSPKHKNIVLGIMFSNAGTIAYTTALSLYILEVTQSVMALSVSLLLNTLPIILASLISGIVADRFNKLKIIVRMDTLRIFLGTIVLIAILSMHNPQSTVSLIYLQIVVFAILETFQTSSYQAILPDVLSNDELLTMNSTISGFGEFISLISPVIGTFIYTIFGIFGIFLFLILSILISIYYEIKIDYIYKREDSIKDSKILPIIKEEIRDTRNLLKYDVRVTSLYFNGFATHLFLTPFIGIGLPYIVKTILNGSDLQFGMLSTLTAVGGLMAVLIVKMLHSQNVSQSILVGILGMILGSLGFAFLMFPEFIIYLKHHTILATVILGFILIIIYTAFGYYGIYFSTFLQQTISSKTIGKGMSMIMLFNSSGRLIGYILFGYLFNTNLWLPVVFLMVGMFSKILIHIPFLCYDKNKEIK